MCKLNKRQNEQRNDKEFIECIYKLYYDSLR